MKPVRIWIILSFLIMSLFVGSILYIYDSQIVGFGNLMKESMDLSVSEKLHIAFTTMSEIRTIVIVMEYISGGLTGLMVILVFYTIKSKRH